VTARAALATLLLCAVASAAEPASYEFLLRQGRLQLEYKQYAEATATLRLACSMEEGLREVTCWQQLAAAAERAGRVGVAIDAWNSAGRLGLAGAGPEAARLKASWGSVVFVPPPGRQLPSHPGELAFEGLLIDPALKESLAAIQRKVAAEGLPTGTRWLPAGNYTFGGVSWTVTPDESTEVLLPTSTVPWRPSAFRLAEVDLAPLGGPTELGVGLRVHGGGSPGASLGLVPIGGAIELRLARHVGPARLELRATAGLQPTRSMHDDRPDRSGFAVPVTGQADLGLDLAPDSKLTLTPHLGVLGGSLGRVLVACRAQAVGGQTVSRGECRLPAAGLGGAAGLDFAVPLDARGRVQLRWGLQGEAGGAWLLAGTGDALKGGGHELLAAAPWRFAFLRGGVDVGASVRF
jgi:hypothetical protein